ncbi:hypothetical protein SAY86_018823 [Trapa natans]|uniref:Uncharacterized protein n=1 Tax=Trapa natans TaxID=22666 RepID=A0AAN7LFQ4_TRANT|nr:hypothetical protein SAY86_018823 [Trapa natans]
MYDRAEVRVLLPASSCGRDTLQIKPREEVSSKLMHTVHFQTQKKKKLDLLASLVTIFEVYPLDAVSEMTFVDGTLFSPLARFLLTTMKVETASNIVPRIPPVIPKARTIEEACLRSFFLGITPTAKA